MTIKQRRTYKNMFNLTRDVLVGLSWAMDTHEFQVAWFIFRRTAIYGDQKEYERIPFRHFFDGVWDTHEEDTVYVAPLGMTKRILLQSIEHLEAKGIIEVRRSVRGTSEYRLCGIDEIDERQVQAYVMQYQPRLAERLGKAKERITERKNRLSGWCQGEPTLGVRGNQGLGVRGNQRKYT